MMEINTGGTMRLEATIDLGGDSDCETCGYSYNHIAYTYDTVTGLHAAGVRYGCTGADVVSNVDGREMVKFLAAHLNNEGRAEVQELIEWVKSSMNLQPGPQIIYKRGNDE
ncbi:hypothetical protein SEA_PACERPAUL_62 [Mycobacterium phage PacerPaul]|nr:hypothetical protein SEA_PACERPAUL_62 [Mycobacterium phage PacerPaul]